MQDGVPIGDDPGAWLREHFKDDPEPEVRIVEISGTPPSPAAYARILEILFSSHPQKGAV